MLLTTQQCWQEAHRRLLLLEAEHFMFETKVEEFLATLPLRLPDESYSDWLKRGQKLAKVIPFSKINFRYITEVQRLAADSRETKDALPEKALTSNNKQFRLMVEELVENKLRLTIEALGLASSKYAQRLIGIAAENSKDDLICLIYLDEDGEGVDESLENTPAIRQALLRPVIALIE
jgi:hypothetical protein